MKKIFAKTQKNTAGDIRELCFKYRWVIALLIFALCVSLRLSGSSIGYYNNVFPTTIEDSSGTLLGKSRAVRTDEWSVQTPVFFSQVYNDFGLYSDAMSLSSTNMVLDYYAPVWDITVIGKPLSWGYLLFGNSVGLSWYWCGQLMLLFMLSLELFLIITKGSRALSLAGAFMIAFSPAIQWWFLPHMPVVIMFAEALFVVGYHFFTAKRDLCRALLSFAAAVSAIGFALSIFPSFQVPCLYAVVALLAASLYRDRKAITFTGKQWYMIAAPVIFAGLVLAHFVATSYEGLEMVLNSAYPGKRVSTGGDKNVSSLFTDITSLFLPFKDITYTDSNNCEAATYIHFAPFIAALAPRIFVKRRREGKSNAVGIVLLATLILMALYMLVGIPEWLAEITLLKYCNRMQNVYGFFAAVFTVWGLNELLRRPDILKLWQKIVYPLVYIGACAVVANDQMWGYLAEFVSPSCLKLIFAIVIVLAFFMVIFFAIFNARKLTAALTLLVMIICGATVNPVEQGISAITNHPVYEIVKGIGEEDADAQWLCCTDSHYCANYLIACGVKTIGATNFYYDEEKWSIIDPDKVYEEETNRYSNQTVNLTAGTNSVSLISPDFIEISITPDTLQGLGVDYIFTNRNYDDLLTQSGVDFQRMEVQDNYRIYRLEG